MGETGNIVKHIEWRDRDENLVGRISKCLRYLIDVTRLDPLSLGKVRGGSSALASSVLLDMLGR